MASAVTGILWAPGWTVFGARYEALVVQPFTMADAGAPLNQQSSGIHNTLIAPIQLGWQLGDTGFHVKTGLAVTVPDGTISGENGLADPGAPWWIFQPLLSISYIKHGWNLTGNFSVELNTPNTKTHYRTGDILHADFAVTQALGNWTVGPVASYIGQVNNDTSSAFYRHAINVNRYNLFAVGALVGYKFGPATVNLWATKDIVANASGGPTGPDRATILKGYKVFANLNFRF
ncbi:SphA family protein [Cupriavidus sp. D39]|uniref:SphA family protein n=1 Tax=Cupriavidus sp. D39 TaxID=2997877 RepID=UPI002271D8D7|nr:transporter [Cupriavidus sp. D39]MCY0857821.1 transporter [Cupriavidus sp. D39]